MKLRLLGDLSVAEFLAEYWQKKPLLIRGAMPGFADPIAPDEVAGLAMEVGINARLVQEKGGKRPWQLRRGPFAERVLTGLPSSHWTLLVSNLEEWSEAAALLLDQFAFIPHWRADDLMVSLAPPGGSVGPHVDSYDVFLLQGQGQRTWAIQTDPDLTWRPGLDLRLLTSFVAQETWTLGPGDMLYLPPGVAHHGVAESLCLTYSVGFRAPVQSDLLDNLYQLPPELISQVASEELYGDPDLTPREHPGELTAQDLARVRRLVLAPLDHPEVLGRWFGAFVTRRQSAAVAPAVKRRRPTEQRLQTLLGAAATIWRSDEHRMAYFKTTDAVFLFVDGDEWQLHPRLLPLIACVSGKRRLSGRELSEALPRGKHKASGSELLKRLFAAGVLVAGSQQRS